MRLIKKRFLCEWLNRIKPKLYEKLTWPKRKFDFWIGNWLNRVKPELVKSYNRLYEKLTWPKRKFDFWIGNWLRCVRKYIPPQYRNVTISIIDVVKPILWGIKLLIDVKFSIIIWTTIQTLNFIRYILKKTCQIK
jgi:hypothetical protein